LNAQCRRGEQTRPDGIRVGHGWSAVYTLQRPAFRCVLTFRKISSYSVPVSRRKPGTLLPLETEILDVALSLLRSGQASFHGFGLAQTMREQSGSRSLTAHGTLYKALSRLEEFGLLTSRWEEAAAEGRPRRRLYELTGQGARVAEQALAGKAAGRAPRVASEPA
jgi:PadR family transcriptional regulator